MLLYNKRNCLQLTKINLQECMYVFCIADIRIVDVLKVNHAFQKGTNCYKYLSLLTTLQLTKQRMVENI